MFNSILLVCVGNICRSAVAERLMRDRFPTKQIHSAGIAALVGKSADRDAVSIAGEQGVSLTGHRARQLDRTLCRDADLILVMERGHCAAIADIDAGARGKTMLFGHWLSQQEVPDPYRRDREAHEHVYHLLMRCADSWIGKL